MGAFHPPKNRALRVEVAHAIVGAIIEGELKPGDRIFEQRISEEMGISRAPVREAIRELEGQGILVAFDRKGAFVASLTTRDIDELLLLRGTLEGLAIRLAVARVTPEDLERLDQCVDRMAAAAGREDVRAFVEQDLLFHEMLCELSDHRQLIRVLGGLRNLTRLFMAMSKYSLGPGASLMREAEAHRALIAALAARDAEAAENELQEHIRQAASYLGTWPYAGLYSAEGRPHSEAPAKEGSACRSPRK